MTPPALVQEFDRQLQNLLHKDYPHRTGLPEKQFLAFIQPLRQRLASLTLPDVDYERGTLPFVIVITSRMIPAETAMTLTERDGYHGITKLFPHTPADFSPLPGIIPSDTSAYLLLDIDRGKDTLNVRPADALPRITARNRSPLTIDEGIAVITHYPDFLKKNNCFSLLASRHAGDKRVPAIWINAAKQPNLGWCWEGNPHTWLGSASCRERITA